MRQNWLKTTQQSPVPSLLSWAARFSFLYFLLQAVVAADVFWSRGRRWGKAQRSTEAMLPAATLAPLVVQGLCHERAALVGVPAMQRPSPQQGLGTFRGKGEATA